MSCSCCGCFERFSQIYICTIYANLNISTQNNFETLNISFHKCDIALYPKIKNFFSVLLIFIFISIFKKKKIGIFSIGTRTIE